MKFSKIPLLIASLAAACTLLCCQKESQDDLREKDYGYVQFKLYKEASYEAKAVVPELDYLHDACKILVMLQFGDLQISQTLPLNAANNEAAEYGLRSDKLKLVSGSYSINAFTLYDALDRELYQGGPAGEFEVIPGGLCSYDITAKTSPRGKVQFTLYKNFTKAVEREYTFDEIAKADISVKNTDSGVKTAFTGLKASFDIVYDESQEQTSGYLSSQVVCDSLLSIKGGNYVIDSYTLYDKNKKLLEYNDSPVPESFSVSDNKTTRARVAVNLSEAADYMKDYFALKEIWESLDGPNWYYFGEDWPRGSNWNFNKDPDLWGAQPGVQLHSNGRVALINISDFGFRGHLSPAIGELSELVELYLGTHNDLNLLEYDPTVQPGASSATRMERHKEYLRLVHPASQLSEPVARALMEHNISIPEISLYKEHSEDELIEKGSGRSLVKPMDVVHGKLCNGLKSLPEEIGKLKKLETLNIANGELESLPASMANLEQLTDLEIYNCSKMTKAPAVLAQLPSLISVNLGNNSQMSSSEIEMALHYLSTGASAANIQILYLNKNNISRINGEEMANMHKLGLLDLAENRISEITKAFGSEVGLVQIYLDHNMLSSLPVDENGLFMRIDDVESFTASFNNFTELPDIFTADCPYVMGSVDFSFNHISKVQNGSAYKGLRVETLTLNNNPELEVLPVEFASSKSIISNWAFRACSVHSVPGAFFEGENVKYIRSIDLSYNHLDDLPKELHGVNVPYLYGIDLSYNRFKSFPFEPLDSAYLTVFGIRGQRDEKGERCLEQWPTGLYNHKGLRGFYIGSNNLGMIDDTISSLIYFLEISDNPNIIFDASDICKDYAVGQYYLIYDKTQDIRGCEYIALD